MAIPKIIHYCWLGRNPKPQSVLRCIESWKKFCPDYEIKEWNEDNLDLSYNLYTKQAYEARAWAFATDYIRLWIVYTYGGVYLDTDVQLIKSLDPLLKNKAFMGFENKEYIASGLGFGAEAGSRAIHEQMKIYESIKFVNADGTFNRVPTPEYLTKVMKSFGLTNDTGKIQNVLDMTCYPKEYFAPKDFSSGRLRITKNTYSIHHYDSSWYTIEERERRKHDLKVAYFRRLTYIPRKILEEILGTTKYKRMVSAVKRNLLKGKQK